ncbi:MULTISPECIES: hypothetical protein [unclassified Tolypothrix]|uniref:hypothetical protein n=1 Tax=unclassified Tolypothrix TaxID=2649714 RepID=UPI0005F776FC|nr:MULTISPECIES: hypothetical protein [unclassified Tolypothrix]MBE9082438.1 hypothetical protein [Tolypothrix sp. LEGE 11397]UYD28575.1 hypothetical protein HGR01_11365 [Tolypothrix sp. PCC 7712]UYD35515.1 hypothetical protein HG267_07010 [Tolypothrix sp. PCC 7601]BAY94937.1 hypothetical protein NIES3275_69920 [Microchaete diplosiphon NIES-3275]
MLIQPKVKAEVGECLELVRPDHIAIAYLHLQIRYLYPDGGYHWLSWRLSTSPNGLTILSPWFEIIEKAIA